MNSLEVIGDLYRKLGFSAARRTSDDLAEMFCRFFEKPRRLGSELGQLLAHANDGEQVRERLTAEGVADVDAFFAGRWSSEQDTLGDLLLERFLVRDMDQEERAQTTAALEQSPQGRELLDRLLKQRLIFLADYPAEPFAQRVVDIIAAQAEAPEPRRKRPNLRQLSITVAAVATTALLGVGLLTQARSTAPEAPRAEIETPRRQPAPKPTPSTESMMASAAEAPPVVVVESKLERPATRERGNGARLIAYARAGSEVRSIEDGEEVDTDERLVAWVKTRQAGYAAVISIEAERTRIYFAESGEAVAIPAGGPTRLGKGRPLPGDVELVLLVSPEPFEVRPIIARMRRGASPTTVFDGTVRRMHVRLAPTEIAAGSQ